MAYDEGLAERLREVLEGTRGITEKKMFGGLCFLFRGHMVCGVARDTLMLRVGPDAYGTCLEEPHAREMDFTGRPLRGMIYVDDEGFAEDEDLEAWVGRALDFARTLPSKTGPTRKVGKKVGKKAGRKQPARKKVGTKKTARKTAR